MTDHSTTLNGITLYKLSYARLYSRTRIFETTASLTFIKSDPPTIAMRPRIPTTLHQSGKTKTDVGWHIGTHAKQFTHEVILTLKKYISRQQFYYNPAVDSPKKQQKSLLRGLKGSLFNLVKPKFNK
jgi:hypothetical protein